MTEAAVQSASLGQEANGAAVTAKRVQHGPVFGPGAVFVFAASAIGLTFSGQLSFSTIVETWSGTNLVWVAVLALVASLIHAYTFAAIGAVGRMSRRGQGAGNQNPSGWMLSGRALDTPLAFSSSLVMAAFLALGSGVLIGSIIQEVLPLFARGLAVLFDSRWLLNNLGTINSQGGIALYGTLGVLLVFFLLFISPRVTNRFLLFGLILSGLAWLVVCIQLAQGTPYGFQLAFDGLMGDGVFVYQVKEARNLGLQAGFNPQMILAAGLAVGMLIFSGYFFPSYFASEVKTPHKSLLRSGALAVLVCGGLLITCLYLAQRLIPVEWFAVQSIFSHLPQYQSTTLPWLPFYAAVLNPNLYLFWLVGAGWISGMLCLAVVLAYTASRIIQSWPESGFLPEGVNFIHPELHSPLIAVLLVCILAEMGLVVFSLGFSTKFWLPLAVACAQIVPVLALIRLPFRQKELFEQSGALVNRKIGPIPLVTVSGILSLMLLFATIFYLLFSPVLGTTNLNGGLAFVAVFLLGLAWYTISQANRRHSQNSTAQ